MSNPCHDRFKAWISQTTGGDMLGEVVVAELYDAAQVELAALREDLDECDGERHRLRDKLNSVEQSLAAAEQRNASLSNAMRRAIEWFDDGVGRSHEEFSMIQDMRASLLQPTESGASE